jgi:hypothetical protein
MGSPLEERAMKLKLRAVNSQLNMALEGDVHDPV